MAALAIVYHCVGFHRVHGETVTVSSAICDVNWLCALAVVQFKDSLLLLGLTQTYIAGWAAPTGICCFSARFTVQGVKGRTSSLGFLGNKLSVELLTGILHTFVIRRYVRAVDLNNMHRHVVRCGENTVHLNTCSTTPSWFSLIFITSRTVFVADDRFADNDVQLGDRIHFGATVAFLAGPGRERL